MTRNSSFPSYKAFLEDGYSQEWGDLKKGVHELTVNELHSLRNAALELNIGAIKRLTKLTGENINQPDVVQWIPFFERLNLVSNEWQEFFVRGYIMNQLGPLLRSKLLSDREAFLVANHPILKVYIFNSFVDYETLGSDAYFGRLVQLLDPQSLEEETFKKSLILMGHYLKGDRVNMVKWSEALSRYPTDKTYFPIINSRIWAARFIHGAIKEDYIDEDLQLEWLKMVKKQPDGQKLFYTMEALPILVRYSDQFEIIDSTLKQVEVELQSENMNFPLSHCVETSMFIASKGNFYRKLGRVNESKQLLQDLYKRPCLASYQGYAFRIASGV
jgi:hypothetical protein